MEAYQHFHTIIYKWLQFFGRSQGHNIFKENSKANPYMILSFVTSISIPCMYMWTVYNYNDDLAMKATGYLGIGYQVCHQWFFFFIFQ